MATTTFIELCQQLIDDAGISGEIVSVVAQTGEFRRVVNWILRATTEIEGSYFNWNFLHEFHSLSTVVDQQDYPAPTNLNLWDNAAFKLTDDEQPLNFEDWNRRKHDATLPVSGDPYLVTVLPSKALRVYDTPSAIVTIGAQYWRMSTVLEANGDEPGIPVNFRNIIVAKALVYYADYESADESRQLGLEMYMPLWEQLKASELPGFQASSALNTGVRIQVQVPYAQGHGNSDGYEF